MFGNYNMKRSEMKFGYFQTINNTVHYNETECNVTVILRQISEQNVMLTDQVDVLKIECRRNIRLICLYRYQ